MTEKSATGFDNGSSLYVEANEIRFHCRIDGRKDAPWLVFSNSLAANLSMWDGQIAVFENAFRILRYDQRGHGGTEVPREPCTFDQLTDDVVALFDALAIRRATFVGLSMGAITALQLAARYPGRIDRIVACDGQWAAAPGSIELWEERLAVLRDEGMQAMVEPTVRRWFRPEFIASNPPVLEKIRRMIATTPAEGYIACVRALQQYDIRECVPQISVPTLLLAGAADGTMPQVMREMQQTIAGANFVEIPDAGHLPNVENPEVFNRALAGAVFK
jgi:3-oxoadipate enol-lactonase